jgi:hypothetical protein
MKDMEKLRAQLSQVDVLLRYSMEKIRNGRGELERGLGAVMDGLGKLEHGLAALRTILMDIEARKKTGTGDPRMRHQEAVLQLVRSILGGVEESTPEWLMRPGRKECGERWPLVQRIYRELTRQELPEVMPTRERRHVDCVLRTADSAPRIIEVDEVQHFNCYRAATLRLYPPEIRLAFDRKEWTKRSEAKRRLEGGGFARERPPLFRGPNGRHKQRAFRDALCDILPLDHGFLPTLRIANFEVADWLETKNAGERMKDLLDRKLSR